MFRFLIVLVEIAVLVMLLRTSFVQYLLEDIQQDVTEILTEISLKFEQTQLNDLRLTLQPHISGMRDFQKDYVMQITSSKAELKQFYVTYCEKKDINPYVNGANLSLVCHAIINSHTVDVNEANNS